MEQRLKIIDNNKTSLTLLLEENKQTDEYLLLGLNKMYEYEKITKTKDNKITLSRDKLNNMREIQVQYLINNKEHIDRITTLKTDNSDCETLNVRIINSYNGITFSYINNTIYDKYYIYEKNDQSLNLIIETENFQTTSKLFKENNYYYIEGYNKENDVYVLETKSKEFPCKPEKITFQKECNLSIIIPTYNAEVYISRCIDSILLQTFTSYEIIIVNDESTDNTSKILDWYKENYKDRIKIINRKNGGVASARNTGIDNAKGAYIAFVDNDDLLHPKMYEYLYNAAKKYNSDIAIGKTLIRNDKNDYEYYLNIPNQEGYIIYDYEKMMTEKNSYSDKTIFFVAVWNKIIKTSLVKKHKFPEHNYYEDTAFTRNIYSYIDKFVFVPNAIYVWDKRFQKTIGTATNNYKKKESTFLHKAYIYSVFYAIENGNKNRIQILLYDCVKEVIDFLKSIKCDQQKNETREIYKEKIKEVHNKYNLLENDYLKNDTDLYTYIKNLLNE